MCVLIAFIRPLFLFCTHIHTFNTHRPSTTDHRKESAAIGNTKGGALSLSLSLSFTPISDANAANGCNCCVCVRACCVFQLTLHGCPSTPTQVNPKKSQSTRSTNNPAAASLACLIYMRVVVAVVNEHAKQLTDDDHSL